MYIVCVLLAVFVGLSVEFPRVCSSYCVLLAFIPKCHTWFVPLSFDLILVFLLVFFFGTLLLLCLASSVKHCVVSVSLELH